MVKKLHYMLYCHLGVLAGLFFIVLYAESVARPLVVALLLAILAASFMVPLLLSQMLKPFVYHDTDAGLEPIAEGGTRSLVAFFFVTMIGMLSLSTLLTAATANVPVPVLVIAALVVVYFTKLTFLNARRAAAVVDGALDG